MTTRIRIQEFNDDNLVRQVDLEPMKPAVLDWVTVPVDSYDDDFTTVVAKPQYHVITLKVKTQNGLIQHCPHDTAQDCTCTWKERP